jgi:hypothetical protein
MRIVYELKRDAIPNVVLNKLYKYTQLQNSFSINNICLVDGRPRMVNLKDMIEVFVKFRHDVVVRRAQYDLRKAEERAHILEGLKNDVGLFKLSRMSSINTWGTGELLAKVADGYLSGSTPKPKPIMKGDFSKGETTV